MVFLRGDCSDIYLALLMADCSADALVVRKVAAKAEELVVSRGNEMVVKSVEMWVV